MLLSLVSNDQMSVIVLSVQLIYLICNKIYPILVNEIKTTFL